MHSKSPPIRLEKSSLAAAAAMLAEAFIDDPFISFLHPNPATRTRLFAKATHLVLRYGEACGEVWAISPRLEGVAVWLPPGRATASTWDMLRFGMLQLPFQIGIRSTRIALAYADHAAKMRERHMRGPFWYLQLLGVAPAHHGAGFGGRLLRHVLARLDRENVPCCLDTENEKNVAIYEHFGFRLLETSEVPGTACPVWFMARDAQNIPSRAGRGLG